MENVVS